MDRETILLRILLLGANGQLGQELSRTLTSLGKVKACGRGDVDLTDELSITKAIDKYNPDVIVNAAAYTAVDKAETERDLAFKVNANAVVTMASEAAKRDIWLVHYSTDYVFDGTKSIAYTESDAVNPINVYGESKLAGEQAITLSGCKHLIFRTTWVIGKDGGNFAKTILRLAADRDALSIIDDQFGVPTTPNLIAKVTIDAIQAIMHQTAWVPGIYHLAPHGETTWYGIAKTLLDVARDEQLPLSIVDGKLNPIATTEYPTPASRPASSRLSNSKLEQQLSFKLPNWKHDFIIVAKEIIEEIKQNET